MSEDPSSGFDSLGGAVVSDGDNCQATHRAAWEGIVGGREPRGGTHGQRKDLLKGR